MSLQLAEVECGNRPYGLFSAVRPETILDEKQQNQWQREGFYYWGDSCKPGEILPVGCGAEYTHEIVDENGETVVVDGKPSFHGRNKVEGCLFMTINGYKCDAHRFAAGDDYREIALNNLERREEFLVERALWSGWSGLEDREIDEDCPVSCWFGDVEPENVWCEDGAVLCPGEALTALEDALAGCCDTPIIHVPRPLINYLKPYLLERDGQLRTCLGSIVVAGAGYDGNGPNSDDCDGKPYMFGTGAMRLLKGDVCLVPDYTDDEVRNVNFRKNEIEIRAERIWGVGFDPCCGIHAVRSVYC